MTGLHRLLLPENRANDADEVVDQVDLGSGDRAAKRSGFAIMLLLSSLIATAGVLSDSTATVIGAMIIAPLATPILGIAIGIVTGRAGLAGRSVLWVIGGAAVAVTIGALVSLTVSDPGLLTTNSQVTGRTSPGLLDLLAAFATGTAGAFAMARKDLSAVLPGVAISISLVPPLSVVGVALGHGDTDAAFGAFTLFGSNVVALIVAGSLVFTLAGYARRSPGGDERRRRRSYLIVAALTVGMTLPLAANSLLTIIAERWIADATAISRDWLAVKPEARVTGVELQGTGLVVEIRSPDTELPDTGALRDALHEEIPTFIPVSIELTLGSSVPLDPTTAGVQPTGSRTLAVVPVRPSEARPTSPPMR
ncbi:TIGR00341 family protein [Homoserinibacter sp. GY 40078]|uniref:TIGR00341 family protein n=1 Tax=Homoserinibacter sp. GY 40078 TaxID=2603275 RepID=UPI002102A6F4|nr:TIGR00341 family protein [Homoserinibacter sp. GY 40078]